MRAGRRPPARAQLAALGAALLAGAAARGEPPVPTFALPGPSGGAAVLLARGGDAGDLPVAVAAVPLELSEQRALLRVGVTVDRTALVAPARGRLALELHVHAVASDGAVVARLSEGFLVDGAGDGGGELRWSGRLAAPRANLSLRVLVRERSAGAFALRSMPLVLAPAVPGVPLALAQPDAPRGEGLDLLSPTAPPGEAAAAPELRPRLAGGEPARFEAYTVGEPEGFALRLGALDAPPLPLTVLARTPLGGGLERWTLEVEVPPAGGEQVLFFETTAPAPPAALRLTIDGARLAAGAEGPAAPEPHRERPGKSRAEIVPVYLAAWRTAALGDRGRAASDLARFEASRHPRDIFDSAAKVEGALVARLAARDYRALLPLSQLYRALGGEHLRGGRVPLARRAHEVQARLIDRLVVEARKGGDLERAVLGLEGLAAQLLADHRASQAIPLLERALALAPERSFAPLTLAVFYERDRRHAEAAAALDRVLAVDPSHREARLHRARIHALAGVDGAADADLDRLLGEPVADWVGVVAAQVRARRRIERGDADGAALGLREAVARWPAEPSLAVALAHAERLIGNRAASRAAAVVAAAPAALAEASPRKRYAEPPAEVFASIRAALELQAQRDLAALAAALEER
jgi:hypothetical protein